MKSLSTKGLKVSVLFFAATALVACKNEQDPGVEYAPDMYDAVPLEPYTQIKTNIYNPGGLNMREPAEGTVARGKMGYTMYLSSDEAEVAGVELKNPLPYTSANLAEGKILYSRFCSPCHGESGDGQGLVGQKFKGVPSYTAGRVASLPAGHIYHVITNGRGRMRPHDTQVNPTERWKIVMFVQQLQKGETGVTVADEQAQQEANEATPENSATGTTSNN
ncbi:c-type cytochrome [Pontibacter beigongshangensis]|uniref:c-type cytochrome n=1 Tax=Pontibacter beigongshangensis TaxID=2574733 RepID=UPI001650C5E4|nr:cytochrome c [Pontibacter beigongshangensis]